MKLIPLCVGVCMFPMAVMASLKIVKNPTLISQNISLPELFLFQRAKVSLESFSGNLEYATTSPGTKNSLRLSLLQSEGKETGPLRLIVLISSAFGNELRSTHDH